MWSANNNDYSGYNNLFNQTVVGVDAILTF